VVAVQEKRDAAFSALTVDADDRFVITANILRVDQ
jgi:hypothetical protein